MCIYNTTLYYITFASNYKKKLLNANASMVNLTLLSLRTAVISLSHFFPFLKVMKTLYLAIWANGNAKNIFSALEVYPKIMTSAAEKLGSVNKN